MADNSRMMLALEIGGTLLIEPDPDESLDAALERIKTRASKHRSKGRSYKVTLEAERVQVIRVQFGQNRKEEKWESIRAGERFLVHENFTDKQKRALQNRINYLRNFVDSGQWQIIENGKDLFVYCRFDKYGDFIGSAKVQKKSLSQKEIWLRSAALCRGQAAHSRGEASLQRGSPVSRTLTNVADRMDERAAELEALAELWNPAEANSARLLASLAVPSLSHSDEHSADRVVVPSLSHNKEIAGDVSPFSANGVLLFGAVFGAFGSRALVVDNKNAAVRQLGDQA